jgi:hypothetical protein
VLTRRLPLLTAAAFAVGAVNAHRLPPRTVWGDVYGHVPNHLVTAGMALLVAASLLVLARLGTTPRGRRARALAAGAWGVVSAVFLLDAVGGGIGDRTGDFRVHTAAMVLLPVAGLLLLAASALLLVTRGGWAPWPLRLAVLTSVPGTLALNEASSALWLTLGLVAAGVWVVVAVHAARRDEGGHAMAADVRAQRSGAVPLLQPASAVPGADAQPVAGDGRVHDLVDVDAEAVGRVLGRHLHRSSGELRLPRPAGLVALWRIHGR